MIYVCNLLEMERHVRTLGPSHLVSLVSPDELPPTPRGLGADCHLRIAMHDISAPLSGHILPGEEHVTDLIAFVRAWRHDQGPLLVHCSAGISRSMAAALITLVVKADGRELEAATQLRRAAAHAYPNRRMIALADQLLGCSGRLIAAREAMGLPQLTFSGRLVQLPLLP